MDSLRNDVRVAVAIVAVAAAMAAFWYAPAFRAAVQDDGFIYCRIADNAAHGRGPVFNPGDRVDAATSPVWVWLLALAVRIGIAAPVAAQIFGLLAWLAAILVASRWALELGGGDSQRVPPRSTRSAAVAARSRVPVLLLYAVALAFPLAAAFDARSVSYAFSGMETTLAALTWLLATRACVRLWWMHTTEPRAALWVLLAGLVRPEYALLVIALAFTAWRSGAQTPRSLLRTLAPALIGAVLYLLAHTLYFGTPWPNTWIAKRQADLVHLRIGLAYLAGLPVQYPWFFLGFAALAVRPLRAVAIAVGLGVALYALHVASLGGDHFVFYRPFVILLPMMLAMAGAAALHFVRDRRIALRALAVGVAAATLAGAAMQRMPAGAFAWVRNAAQLGHALARTYPPDTRVGLFAIGAAGYTSGLPIVDALGLADRHIARRDLSHEHACELDIGHERGDPAYLMARADVIVPFAAFAPKPFESLDEVRDGFHSHKRFLELARRETAAGNLRLRNIEYAPGAYWLVLERTRPRIETSDDAETSDHDGFAARRAIETRRRGGKRPPFSVAASKQWGDWDRGGKRPRSAPVPAGGITP
jgi:hypothetical protein